MCNLTPNRNSADWIKPTPCSQEYCGHCGLTPKMLFGMLPTYCPHCGTKKTGKVVKIYELSGS